MSQTIYLPSLNSYFYSSSYSPVTHIWHFHLMNPMNSYSHATLLWKNWKLHAILCYFFNAMIQHFLVSLSEREIYILFNEARVLFFHMLTSRLASSSSSWLIRTAIILCVYLFISCFTFVFFRFQNDHNFLRYFFW